MIPQLVTGQDVVDAVLSTFRTYLPNVLAKVGDGTLPMPVSYSRPSTAAARSDATELPLLSVSVLGTEGMTERDEGFMAVRWALDVALLCRAETATYEAVQRHGTLYAAALATVLLERGDLGGFARRTIGIVESYDDAEPSAGRSLAEVHVTGVIEVIDARRRQHRFTLPGPTAVDATALSTTVIAERS